MSALDPLPINASLVDAAGRPTTLFIQRWNELRRVLDLLSTGVTGTFDTEVDYLRITVEHGRVTKVETEVI